ncbi:MAG TPA: hypothetical protein VGO03_09180 [Acidimicrobiia bacterium]
MTRAFHVVRNLLAVLGLVFAVIFAAGWLQAREEMHFIDLDDEGHRAASVRSPALTPRRTGRVPSW